MAACRSSPPAQDCLQCRGHGVDSHDEQCLNQDDSLGHLLLCMLADGFCFSASCHMPTVSCPCCIGRPQAVTQQVQCSSNSASSAPIPSSMRGSGGLAARPGTVGKHMYAIPLMGKYLHSCRMTMACIYMAQECTHPPSRSVTCLKNPDSTQRACLRMPRVRPSRHGLHSHSEDRKKPFNNRQCMEVADMYEAF